MRRQERRPVDRERTKSMDEGGGGGEPDSGPTSLPASFV